MSTPGRPRGEHRRAQHKGISMTPTTAFDTGFLEDALKNVFAEWVTLLDLRLIAASPGEVVLEL
ncbi:MAG: hypothetical protein ABUL50_04650, partial [Rhizobacter sp.]